jgi:hypothetical protein
LSQKSQKKGGDKMRSQKLLFSLLAAAIIVLAPFTLALAYPSGMVSYWQFDEGSGTTVYDTIGSNNGTIYGALWTSGISGTALSFNGTNDYISVANDPSLNPDSITVEAWVNYSASPSSYDTFIVNKTIGADQGYGLGDGYYEATGEPLSWGNYSFTLATTDSYYSVDSGISVKVNEWVQVVGTYDDTTGIAKIFVNGQEKNQRYLPSAIVKDNNELDIGTHLLTPIRSFNGLIDEVAIYNRALTSNEVQQRYLTIVPEPISSILFVTGGATLAVRCYLKRKKKA